MSNAARLRTSRSSTRSTTTPCSAPTQVIDGGSPAFEAVRAGRHRVRLPRQPLGRQPDHPDRLQRRLGENVALRGGHPLADREPDRGHVSSAGARPTGGSSSAAIDLTFDGTRLLPGPAAGSAPGQDGHAGHGARGAGHADGAVPRRARRQPVPGVHLRDGGSGRSCSVDRRSAPNVFNFCPNGVVTRADMAGYLFRAVHGPNTPPPVYQNIFVDVNFNDYNAFYIQGIYDDGITAGCSTSPLIYCPNVPVTRAQMSVFVWKDQHGSEPPPPCTGVFTDVPCPDGSRSTTSRVSTTRASRRDAAAGTSARTARSRTARWRSSW